MFYNSFTKSLQNFCKISTNSQNCRVYLFFFKIVFSSPVLVETFRERCEWDEVRTNVDIHTLVRESSVTRQDIRDILVSFDNKVIPIFIGNFYRILTEISQNFFNIYLKLRQNSFSRFCRKILLIAKKLLNKKILKWLLAGRTPTQRPCRPLQPSLLCSKIFFRRTSCASDFWILLRYCKFCKYFSQIFIKFTSKLTIYYSRNLLRSFLIIIFWVKIFRCFLKSR